jgi:hypothetical protein
MAKMPPKLGQRSRASHWISRAHILTDAAQIKLAQAVGLSPAADSARLGKMHLKVQHVLGAYCGAIQAVDNAPRASDYARDYGRLERDAKVLLEDLAAFSERMKEDLQAELATVHEIELSTIERDLRFLNAALEARSRVYAAEPDDGAETQSKRRGRPRSRAIEILIETLQSIFVRIYSKDAQVRARKRGAIKARSSREEDELDFVRVSISDAGIRIDNAKLKRLLRRSRQVKESPG